MNGLRILVAAGAAAALACTSILAHADEESGVAVGVRVGGAIPFGNSDAEDTMSNAQRAMLPVWFDAGYRFNRHIYLAVFYQYGVTFPASNSCGTGPATQAQLPTLDPAVIQSNGQTTCDGRDQRFGLELHYHFTPKEFVDPWIGLGLGYEVSTLDYSTGASASASSFQASGPMVDLQLGLDLRFSKLIPFGPFIDLSLSEFGTESYYDANGASTGPVTFNTSVHGWATFGLRVQFNL
jgi:outer membrane protein W